MYFAFQSFDFERTRFMKVIPETCRAH